MDRQQQIAIWKEEAAALKARIATIDADISANPMDPEVLRLMQEEYDANTERDLKETPDNTIFFEAGRPVFDQRVKERHSLADDLVNIEFSIDMYSRREMPNGTIADEEAFAKEHGLELPDQNE